LQKLVKLVEESMKTKERVVSKLESLLDSRELQQAEKDHHARRKPIACGLTIHPGIGCSYNCIYCYVPEMGFPRKIKPYPLNGLQLAYALSINPFFVPGPRGTLLAFGSVTEPFAQETIERTIEYLDITRKFFGNPQQISVKGVINSEQLDRFTRLVDPYISILVTITTLKYYKQVEPLAPPPTERLELAKHLLRRGLHVSLFLRPIIPSVTTSEAREIAETAKKIGIKYTVIGSLRVTPGIIKRLEALSKSTSLEIASEVKKRLPRLPINSRDQVVVQERDLKKRVEKILKTHSLRVLPSSCSANIHSHRLFCKICRWGPCGWEVNRVEIDRGDLVESLEILGCKPTLVSITGNEVRVACRDRRSSVKTLTWIETLLKIKTRPL